MGIKVLKSGLHSTIQDIGRIGLQALGVGVSGAMDVYAMRMANILVGNNEKEAVMEITWIGPVLEFEQDGVISLFGAEMSPTINRETIQMGCPILVRKGDVLRLGVSKKGCRCYLAIRGGFDVSSVFGSKSTYSLGEFGGFKGRALQEGDTIYWNEVSLMKNLSSNWRLSPKLNHYQNNNVIRFVAGKQYSWFTENSQNVFASQLYTVTLDSNRTGYRLCGEQSLKVENDKELLTEGTVFGTIQIPQNGQPIVLMADRQPTGGYPKIGEVITVDLRVLAQKKPKDMIYFQPVSLKEAHQQLILLEKEIKLVKKIVNQKLEVES
ncbi:antagonist of KipI [Salirhabdus euzebyi]|uniref:Antagonist of KipI n=1 Tax=Salirhabdus euzebyi TaxID=394506 RepID=A0A841Q5G7_9BACI|nr:biotin-dependent carboxyltransferase family protein [Salirhabdus euzebyi]MBB6453641.1 antagonist of KipI [Salirhabdus euzebyi]